MSFRRSLFHAVRTTLVCSIAAFLALAGCQPALPPEGMRVGDTCPEIVGTDPNGKQIRLSDYRGKVVLVSFWGTWCGPCRAMLPHERNKVQSDFAGRPFVVFGIANDSSEELGEFLKKHYLPWPNIADGNPGTITRQWKVGRFPSAMLIDPAGVIQFQWFNGMEFDDVWQEVEKAVRTAQS